MNVLIIKLVIFLGLMGIFASCGDTYEYPWNPAWDQTSQDAEDTVVVEKPDTTQTVDPPADEQGSPEEKPESPADEPDQPAEDPTPELPSDDPAGEPEYNPFEGWTDLTSSYGTLPSYIRILKSPEHLQSKKTIAYVAEADMSQARWDVWSVKIKDNGGNLTEATDDSFKTPSEVYSDETSCVIINGGYFYWSGSNRYTASLAVSNSEALAYNIGYEYDDNGKTCYPVRAVFRESSAGAFDACWTYTNWDRTTWMYPAPSSDPTKKPSADFPEGATTFEARTAIGGGPVLIDDGEFVNSIHQEMFSGISPETDQPRTAIGVTDDNKLIFFVCEGREMTAGVKGLTTADVANVLLELGCIEAINLDGGGSSCMLVNGIETIKVSDGSQRAVASTVMLK